VRNSYTYCSVGNGLLAGSHLACSLTACRALGAGISIHTAILVGVTALLAGVASVACPVPLHRAFTVDLDRSDAIQWRLLAEFDQSLRALIALVEHSCVVSQLQKMWVPR
jgi:hypothetical protein